MPGEVGVARLHKGRKTAHHAFQQHLAAFQHGQFALVSQKIGVGHRVLHFQAQHLRGAGLGQKAVHVAQVGGVNGGLQGGMKPLEPMKPADPDGKPCACAGGAAGKSGRQAKLEAIRAERKRLKEAEAAAREQRVAEALAPPDNLPGKLGLTVALGIIWWYLYQMLPGFARFASQSILNLDPASRLGGSVEFFLYDTPKVLLLLALVVFGVGVLRSFFTPERTRRLLAGRNEAVGNVLAALLGIVTPFCSCSAVPLFMGFLGAGVPLGVTFSFLIAAPMVNEIAVVLLYGLLGWKVAALYMAGILTCAGKTCVVIDVDLQDQPELIAEMHAKLAEGFEVVCAKRRSRKGETLAKRAISSFGYYLINKLSDVRIPRDTGDFRIMGDGDAGLFAEFIENGLELARHSGSEAGPHRNVGPAGVDGHVDLEIIRGCRSARSDGSSADRDKRSRGKHFD